MRVNRGSTLITLAPFCWASVTYLKEMGWFSAALLPMIKNTVTVFDIDPVIGHRAASERLCQSRNSGAMSDTGLVFDIDQPGGTHQGLVNPALLII